MGVLWKGLRWLGITAALLLVVLMAILAAFRWQAERREAHMPSEVAPLAGRYLSAADVRVFIQEEGPQEGPAILLVHGTGAWSGAWRPAMTMLGNAGFHAIAIDLPPFGFSERPGQPLYDKQDQGKRIVGVLDALRIRRVILVGHSFGAGPTMEAAFLMPERVRGLVLVDAALNLESRIVSIVGHAGLHHLGRPRCDYAAAARAATRRHHTRREIGGHEGSGTHSPN